MQMQTKLTACSAGRTPAKLLHPHGLQGQACRNCAPKWWASRHRCAALPVREEAAITSEGIKLISSMGVANYQIIVKTDPGVSLYDITPQVRTIISDCKMREGFVNVVSKHTTTAVTINEHESRLLEDIRIFLRKFAPPGDSYLHNDLQYRESPDGWPGGWKAWAEQEPENAHSHIQSMFLGNTESIPVTGGDLCIGRWQSIMLVELDGPRERSVGIQAIGGMLLD